MVTTFTGMRSLDGHSGATWINSTRPVRDVFNKIILLDVNNYALIGLLRNLRKKQTHDAKFEWYEDADPAWIDTVASGGGPLSGVDQTFTPTSAAMYRKYDLLLHNDEGEVAMVIDNDGTDLTLVRDVSGSVTQTAWADGDKIYIIGNAVETGTTSRPVVSTQTDNIYNYCELFREPVEIDNTSNLTKLYGGNDMVYQRQKHMSVHMKTMERAFWFGQKAKVSIDTTGVTDEITTKSYLTGGVFEFMSTTNTFTDSGGYTDDEFEEDLETAMRYGNKTKFMFCAPRVLTVIAGWARDAVRLLPTDETFGIDIRRWTSPHGKINLISQPVFGDMYDTAGNPNYGEVGALLDLEYLWYRYLRDTKLIRDIQANDQDGMKDEFLTEAGLEMHEPLSHSWFQNFALAP